MLCTAFTRRGSCRQTVVPSNLLDNTFGPQPVFQKAPPLANTPPSGGYQFFGQIDIDPHSKHLTAMLKDIDGTTVFAKRLDARPSRDD